PDRQDPHRGDADQRDRPGVGPFPRRAGPRALGRRIRAAAAVHQHLRRGGASPGGDGAPEGRVSAGAAARAGMTLRPAPRPVVPHARPWLGADEEAAALRVLRSARLQPGAEAARLEGLVTRLAGAADAVAVASGTLALGLALEGLGVRPDDQVAVPS